MLYLGSVTAAQHEDGRKWSQGTKHEHGDANYNGWSYGIQVAKSRCIIKYNARHKLTPLMAKPYFLEG